MAEKTPAKYEITFQDDTTETVYGIVDLNPDNDVEVIEYRGTQEVGRKSYKKAGVKEWKRV